MEYSDDQFQRHLHARLVVIESVCKVIASQPGIKNEVLGQLNNIILTCCEANKDKQEIDPDWPLEEHYLRRFAGILV